MNSTNQQPRIYPHMKLAEVLVIASADVPHALGLAETAASQRSRGVRIDRFMFDDGSVMVWDKMFESVSAE